MLPTERQKKMLELFQHSGSATIPDLIGEFGISVETVRRALAARAQQGKIEKVYGGAKLKQTLFSEPARENRIISRYAQKEAIGRKCSEFISDGDLIFIDSGTTTFHIARFLDGKKNLTVISNSIPVVNELMDSGFEVIVVGGRLRRSERSIVSNGYMFDFSQINIRKGFFCAGGITPDNGVSDFDMEESATRRMLLERTKETYVAADSSKIGKDVAIGVMPVSRIGTIVTDSGLGKNFITAFSKAGVRIVLA
jgi:DeoR/GlpR family transcriptional regulator of sugar metabolism